MPYNNNWGYTSVTEDIAFTGQHERRIMIQMLELWNKDGLPAGFEEVKLHFEFNVDSGAVAIVNEDYDWVMVDDNGELNIWYDLPKSSPHREGFLWELVRDWTPEELDYRDINFIRSRPAYESLWYQKTYPAWSELAPLSQDQYNDLDNEEESE